MNRCRPRAWDRRLWQRAAARKPAEVFKLFSPYLTAKVNEKKKLADPAFAKREALVDLLMQTREPWGSKSFGPDFGELDFEVNLDPQWLDLAVSLSRIDLVHALATPGHAAANVLLAKLFHDSCRVGKDHEASNALQDDG